ncbi:hypothetical protein V9L05_16820 [Bernardetia sp. Wsw4-3y2]|uniref:hypothetical protein n=1 Tax=Bernardetia sp. Wsw4-3y2 TaxID=3127471 RepID=UPI0030CDDC5E
MENQSLAIFEFEKPIIYVTFTENTATDENFEEYTLQSHKAFEWERYALIYDISKMQYLAAKYRIMQGKDLENTKDKIAKQSIGLALIAPSFLQRTIVQAIFLVKPYPSKVKVCKTKEEATEWINELLENENIELEK